MTLGVLAVADVTIIGHWSKCVVSGCGFRRSSSLFGEWTRVVLVLYRRS